jgi:hypothetical protein
MHHETVWMLSIMPAFLIVGLMILNHGIVHIRTTRREALELSRLRVALHSELRALHDLYRLNIELIDEKAGYVISGRLPTVVYKSQLGKVLQLDPVSVQKLISVFARNEIAEGILAAHSGGRGGTTYKVAPDSDLERLRQLYVEGIDCVGQTCDALSQTGRPREPERFTSSIFSPAIATD